MDIEKVTALSNGPHSKTVAALLALAAHISGGGILKRRVRKALETNACYMRAYKQTKYKKEPIAERDDLRSIIRTVALAHNVSTHMLGAPNRTQRISHARCVAYYLCRELTGASFPVIGFHLNRGHSTVISGHGLISKRIKDEPKYAFTIRQLRNRAVLAYFQGEAPAQVAA